MAPNVRSNPPFMPSYHLFTCVAGLALPLLSVGLGAAEQPWQELPPLPEPNGGFLCSVVPGGIVVLGGTNWAGGQKNWLTTVHRLDLATLRWSSLEPLPQPLAYALGGVGGSSLIFVGGTTGTAPFQGTVRVAGRKVTSDASHGITIPAVLSAGGQVGDEIICVGGTNDAANVKDFRREAFAWNIQTGQRRTLPPYPGPAFGTAASAVAGDELLVFGGARWDAPTQSVVNLTDAYAFSPRRNAWRRLRPLPSPVRGLAAVPLDAQHLYLAGGYNNDGFTDEAFIYELAGDRYRPAPRLPHRASVGLVKSGDFVFCLGGEDKMKHRSAAVYRIKVSALGR